MFILILLTKLYALDIVPERFDEFLEKAPKLQAKMFEAKAAKSMKLSKANLFAPKLEAKAGVETFSLGTFKNRTQGYGSLEARMNLFSSGQDLAKYLERKNQDFLSEEERAMTQAEQLAQLYEFYYQALAIQDKLNILEAALSTNAKHQAMANRRLKAGLVTNTDLLDFNIYELKVKEAMIKHRISLGDIEQQTRILLGLENGEALVFKKSNYKHSDDFQNAGTRSAKLMEYSLQAANATTTQNQAWWKPRLDLVGRFAQLTQREEDFIFAKDRQEKVIALELTFDFDFSSTPWKEASEASFKEQALAQHLRQQLIQVKEQSHYVTEAEKLFREHLLQVETHSKYAQQHLKQTLDEYARGVKNAPDVLGASERVVESQLELVDANLELQNIQVQKLKLGQF